MKHYLIIFLSCFFISCDPEENDLGPNFIDPNPNDVEIRIKNKTSYLLDSVYINTSGGESLYGNLSLFERSSYSSFRFAYPIFNIKFKVAEKKFSYSPASYDGEEKIANGKYTLEISEIDTSAISFSYFLNED
ncbi:MAG: hypothetical protein KDB74_00080 [Flavobacteriales bacterium]|nr:hypothetical protein [Flavobacteriales bacterium]